MDRDDVGGPAAGAQVMGNPGPMDALGGGSAGPEDLRPGRGRMRRAGKERTVPTPVVYTGLISSRLTYLPGSSPLLAQLSHYRLAHPSVCLLWLYKCLIHSLHAPMSCPPVGMLSTVLSSALSCVRGAPSRVVRRWTVSDRILACHMSSAIDLCDALVDLRGAGQGSFRLLPRPTFDKTQAMVLGPSPLGSFLWCAPPQS